MLSQLKRTGGQALNRIYQIYVVLPTVYYTYMNIKYSALLKHKIYPTDDYYAKNAKFSSFNLLNHLHNTCNGMRKKRRPHSHIVH